MTNRCGTARRPILAGTLGVASLGNWGPGAALSTPPRESPQAEIVVTATRQSDAALAARVSTAIQQDAYIFSDHTTVTVEDGVVRLAGVVRDLSDLNAILRLARRMAGHARVVNEIEYQPVDDDGN